MKDDERQLVEPARKDGESCFSFDVAKEWFVYCC